MWKVRKMARLNKEEQARREGMSYALRIAKEKGIEALEADLKMRNAIGLPIPVSQKVLDEFTENVKSQMYDSTMVLWAVTLRDELGFGEKRIQRILDRFNEKVGCLAGDYTTWQEQMGILKEECNIELTIRENNTDVKVR